MRAFFDLQNPFFKDVPAPLLARFMDQRERDSLENWGVRTTGADQYSVSVELNHCPSAARFIDWCNAFNIVRCDVDRVSDITLFAGRNPMTLGLIQAWESQQGVRDALTSLQPGELYGAIESLSADVLNAGHEQMADMARYAQGNPIAAYDFELMEADAAQRLREAGFDVPDLEKWAEKPAPDFQHTDEFYESLGEVNPFKPKSTTPDPFGRY